MANIFENGDFIARRPVFVDEDHIRWATLFVDIAQPDGWLHMHVLNPFEVKSGNKDITIPVKAVLTGRPAKEKDPKGYIDAEWYDFEVGDAAFDAIPVTLFQKK